MLFRDKLLIKLSNDTGAAVSDLASAQLEAISNGVKAADSVQFLEVAMKAAKGGFTDSSTVISSLTSVLKSYGLEASAASKISDQMMAAAKAGGVSFADMSTKLERVIPVAAKFGVTTDELFASVATLTSQGVPIADAAKQIKSALEKGGKQGLFKVTQGEKFNEMLKQVTASAGATETAFNRVDRTLEEQWGSTLNKIKNTGLKLGMALLPAFQKIIDKFSIFVDKFASVDFSPFIAQIETALDRILGSIDFNKLAEGIGGFFTQISKVTNCIISFIELIWKLRIPILILVGTIQIINGVMFAWALVDKLKNSTALKLISAIVKKGAAFIALKRQLKAAAIAQKSAAGAQWGLNAAMNANPIGLIIAGIVALIAIIVLCVKNWDKITAVLKTAWEWVKNVASMIWDGLCNAFSKLKNYVKENSEKVLALIAIFTGPFGFIISIVKELYENWGAVVEAFKTDGIIAGFKKLGGVILSAVLAPIQGLLEVLAKIPGVDKLLGPAVDKIKNFREELKGNKIEMDVVQDVVPAQVNNVVPRAVTQTTTETAGIAANVPAFNNAMGRNNQTISTAATPATRPMTTAEQHIYRETTNRDQVDIAVRAEQGTRARVTRPPRSPNVRVKKSGDNG